MAKYRHAANKIYKKIGRERILIKKRVNLILLLKILEENIFIKSKMFYTKTA